MNGALTLRFSTQAAMDIQRMTRELSDLQRQVASGSVANDLRGFGDGAARLINAQSLKANADARAGAVSQLEARFGVQAAALSQVSESATLLAKQIRDALSSNDGGSISVDLDMAFTSAIAGLNENWNGQPLFAGERVGNPPVKIDSLSQLMAAAGPADIFDEAARQQTIDLGDGQPIALASKASEMAQPLFDTFKQLKTMLNSAGGNLGTPMDPVQRDQLQAIAVALDGEANTFTSAEGRAGQLQKRFTSERTRMQDRSTLLLKEIGDQSDADLAQVSVRISALLAQYQAAAKTFTDLSKLSLLDYL